ncbi:MAG: hypothetical protein GYA43_11010 [Bacteroidales bacterium]|nr:hypothetical protein [Bacteroidales bacterium]
MEKNTITGRIVKILPAGSKAVIATDKPVTEKLISSVKVYFIEIEGKPVPFFPEYAEVRGENTILVRFEDYTDIERLRTLAGCRVQIRSDEKHQKQPFTVSELKGYRLTDTGKNMTGIITTVTDNNGNILLDVNTEKGKTILIPFHNDFVEEINPEKREIKMHLPEGLSDLNN